VKIAIFAILELKAGKCNIKDERLDRVRKIANSKKETYIQVELTGEDAMPDADAIIALIDSRADLVLKDLEFVETRLGRSVDEKEKALLNKLKSILEKEEFVFNAGLSQEERQAIAGYSLLTLKPVTLAKKEDLGDANALLAQAVRDAGYISFFTAGEKETRAWLIRKGTTAWEAAGAIHSDIQRGFIRAEIIGFEDFIQAGGETQAKQAGKLRLEQKEYVMQDADLANFRFNK
jgi:ribosome-binding ATPase YchF (GTP1/OBG family)